MIWSRLSYKKAQGFYFFWGRQAESNFGPENVLNFHPETSEPSSLATPLFIRPYNSNLLDLCGREIFLCFFPFFNTLLKISTIGIPKSSMNLKRTITSQRKVNIARRLIKTAIPMTFLLSHPSKGKLKNLKVDKKWPQNVIISLLVVLFWRKFLSCAKTNTREKYFSLCAKINTRKN